MSFSTLILAQQAYALSEELWARSLLLATQGDRPGSDRIARLHRAALRRYERRYRRHQDGSSSSRSA
jgi:hypothetical protein